MLKLNQGLQGGMGGGGDHVCELLARTPNAMAAEQCL